LNLSDVVEVDYECIVDPDIDPDSWKSEYECPCCKRISECKTLTGQLQNVREVMPFVRKGTKVILKCDHCGRIFHIRGMDADAMVLEFIGMSSG